MLKRSRRGTVHHRQLKSLGKHKSDIVACRDSFSDLGFAACLLAASVEMLFFVYAVRGQLTVPFIRLSVYGCS